MRVEKMGGILTLHARGEVVVVDVELASGELRCQRSNLVVTERGLEIKLDPTAWQQIDSKGVGSGKEEAGRDQRESKGVRS